MLQIGGRIKVLGRYWTVFYRSKNWDLGKIGVLLRFDQTRHQTGWDAQAVFSPWRAFIATCSGALQRDDAPLGPLHPLLPRDWGLWRGLWP